MINIYCDESCHLELSRKSEDKQKSMVIGGIRRDKRYVKQISEDVKEIKEKHGIYKYNEIKWTKVASGKSEFYKEIIKYFFSQDKLEFRCIVFPDKSKFDYSIHDHEDIYNIMYFLLLKKMIHNDEKYYIYVDKKDTRGSSKFKRLREYLCRTHGDFSMDMVEKIQIVDSRDLQLMQLADLFIGAISYYHRGLSNHDKPLNTKQELVNMIEDLSNVDLSKTTSLYNHKFNVFVWRPRR